MKNILILILLCISVSGYSQINKYTSNKIFYTELGYTEIFNDSYKILIQKDTVNSFILTSGKNILEFIVIPNLELKTSEYYVVQYNQVIKIQLVFLFEKLQTLLVEKFDKSLLFIIK